MKHQEICKDLRQTQEKEWMAKDQMVHQEWMIEETNHPEWMIEEIGQKKEKMVGLIK